MLSNLWTEGMAAENGPSLGGRRTAEIIASSPTALGILKVAWPGTHHGGMLTHRAYIAHKGNDRFIYEWCPVGWLLWITRGPYRP